MIDLPGQIPQQPVKVVFQDDNYDPVKDDRYDPNTLTWHWDNVQVFAEQVGEPPAPPSPELLAAQAPSTSGAAPDSGSATDAPADSDEVSLARRPPSSAMPWSRIVRAVHARGDHDGD